VGEVGESAAGSLDLLDEEVHGFGGPVAVAGAVVVDDLGLPATEGSSEPAQLGHVAGGALDEHSVEQRGGLGWIVDGVHLPEVLLGQEGGQDLILRVSGGQGGIEASAGRVVEAFVAGEQQLADVIESVGGPGR
jgi:hypothetical protein